jgi:hypothetical protein
LAKSSDSYERFGSCCPYFARALCKQVFQEISISKFSEIKRVFIELKCLTIEVLNVAEIIL